MAYYSSPQQYENTTGKRFTTKCPCIHRTGSVRGMVKLGYWPKKEIKLDMGTGFICNHDVFWFNKYERGALNE